MDYLEIKEVLRNEIIQEYKERYNINLKELEQIKKAEIKEDNDLITEFRNNNYTMSEVNDIITSLENLLTIAYAYKLVLNINDLNTM